ncbi:KOW domain-containing RNA-binding protein [Caldicellulosiruptor acetigenus]|uniref:KOW domain-containing RNA-binding protein n=1 Tax=Caldicellulosiruptor acetigenus TaxID=301953 RepID=UPI000403BE61|nr:KOW domain-containing RNA-binding protein [Caldicellulosiruptor acetigenus]WAM37180.1 KOW domain-containing RNA-binding protein [Caldicellulosiruptor acetigenus]
MDLQIGQIVLSKMGRDKNRFFIIFDITDDGYVYLVDGKLRKIKKPKKKKIKHIAPTMFVSEEIKEKILKKKLTDAEVAKVIEEFENRKE